MCKIKILSFLWLTYNNLNKILPSDSETNFITFKTVNSGNDERYDNQKYNYNYNEYINVTMLANIRKYIRNKNIIHELQDNNTCIHRKLNIIEKYTNIYQDKNRIAEFNLLAGNLLNEFYDDVF
jgi:hypothetical protein